MFDIFPKMLYWQGGRSQGRVVQNPQEEIAANKEGWFFARPLDENGNPIWPDQKAAKTLPAEALPPVAAARPTPDFTAMSKAALVTYAKSELELELVPDSMTKAAMIEAIQGASR